MKKYVDKNRKKVVEYKMADKILLNTKNWTWQMKKETKKLMKSL